MLPAVSTMERSTLNCWLLEELVGKTVLCAWILDVKFEKWREVSGGVSDESSYNQINCTNMQLKQRFNMDHFLQHKVQQTMDCQTNIFMMRPGPLPHDVMQWDQ